MSVDIKDMKRALYGVLKSIKSGRIWTEENQSWLQPSTAVFRPNTTAAQANQRAALNGKVRNLSASDMGIVLTCEVSFAAAYAGANVVKAPTAYIGKGATKLHTVVENLLPDWIITDSSEKRSRGWNRTFVHLPSIGQRTQAEFNNNLKKDGIWGHIDGYMLPFQTGLELKTIPVGKEFPDEVPMRYLGQAAAYVHGYNLDRRSEFKPEFWAWVYLPQDLRDFDPTDISTYRVFVKTAEELETLWEEISTRSKVVAALVDSAGFESVRPELSCFIGEECAVCPPSAVGASETV